MGTNRHKHRHGHRQRVRRQSQRKNKKEIRSVRFKSCLLYCLFAAVSVGIASQNACCLICCLCVSFQLGSGKFKAILIVGASGYFAGSGKFKAILIVEACGYLALRISRLFARPRRSWAPAILVVEAWLGRKQTRMQGYHQEGHLLSELQISSASSSE